MWLVIKEEKGECLQYLQKLTPKIKKYKAEIKTKQNDEIKAKQNDEIKPTAKQNDAKQKAEINNHKLIYVQL